MKSVSIHRRRLWLIFSVAALTLICLMTACNPSGEPPVATGEESTRSDVLTIEPSPGETNPDGTPVEPETDDPTGTLDFETLPYDPDLHPGDASLYEGVLIAAVHGTGKNGTEAVISNGYVQLYNNTDHEISLYGASLYYKSDGANPYEQFLFSEDAVIPAGGYYLVRANAAQNFLPENAIMKVEKCDAEWDIYIDNKEVRLLLAPSGWSVGRDEDITQFDDAISVFVATEAYHASVFSVTDLSRNKIAVRTAMEDYSGYHLVNLTKTATPDLQKLRTRTSKGDINEVVASRLNEVFFSHDAGIYEQELTLSLTAKEGYTIYYTTDGTDPTRGMSTSRKTYTSAIKLSDTSAMGWGPLTRSWVTPSVSKQIGAHVIKAYATNGKESTPVYTNTYFITDDLAQYGVSVMSISMPASEVISTNGFYNNFLMDPGNITGGRHRGVGIIEVFDKNGVRVGNSRVEMAVSGNGSSGWGMKSLRLYYKGINNEEGGLQSDLHYDIFDGKALNSEGEAITSFSRLLIRNSGNDCASSYIRDAYMQRVSGGLNVDIMATASTLVFINGEFWGVYNVRERYSPEYVESHYGVLKENVAVIESDYSQVHTNTNADFVVVTGLENDADPFNEMVQYMRDHDLTQKEHYEYVTSLMDVDSFIDMWVTRLFFVARDWPENNIKVWRNRNPEDPSGMDTKWHFTLLDMDMGLYFYDFTGPYENFFWAFDSGSVCGTIMRALIKNEEFRTQFLIRYYQVINEHLTVERLSEELESMIAERDPLMQMQAGRWSGDGFSVGQWQNQCNRMRNFISNRHEQAMNHFYNYFHITEDDLVTIAQKRVSVSFHSGRADVTINGESVENGLVIRLEPDETRTLKIKATAKEGFAVTGITYIDREGNEQSVEGTEATFTVSATGTLSINTKRTGENTEDLSRGSLVAGATYMFYLSPGGDLYAWGDNRYGVLGLDASTSVVRLPTFVMSGVAKVVTTDANAYENGDSTFTTAILTKDGRLLTVGKNTCGQLGRNGTSDDYTLGEVTFAAGVADVSLGHDHMLIVDKSGNLWGIGSNAYGALGTTNLGGNVTSFVKLDTKVEFATAGRRSTAYVKQDGSMWGVGDNRWSKMSRSHGEQIHSPAKIASDITYATSGEHQILAVNAAGKLYYAGWRELGSFNQGGGNNPTFAHVMDGVVKADIYFANMVILTKTGDAYVYGLNTEHGIGSSAVTGGTPKKILSGVADVAAGYGFTAYLMKDGTLYIQGDNSYGQAGNGKSGGLVDMVEAEL